MSIAITGVQEKRRMNRPDLTFQQSSILFRGTSPERDAKLVSRPNNKSGSFAILSAILAHRRT
jgi:hypothetical protein